MAVLHHPRFVLTMRVLFWVALVLCVIFTLLPIEIRTGVNDKTEHMVAFGTLAGLAAFGFPAELRWRVAERLSFVGAMIELVQGIPALHRHSDIGDWIADTVAILVVMAVAALLQPRPARDTAPAA